MVSDPNRPTSEPSPASAFSEVAERISEVRDYAAYYFAAQRDRILAFLRTMLVYAAIGLVGAVAAATVAVVAVVLLVRGIAESLSVLFGDRPWLGDLVTGAAILLVIAGALFIGIGYLTRSFKRHTISTYEKRKRQQRVDHGIDVHERAQN
jgi:hypothetical protein